MKGIFLWGLAVCLLLTMASGALAAPTKGAKIEVVFVLDTTGSMGGLIEGAKEKIWAIANTMATVEPAPDIKMGLIGYRDRGDVYVTKLTPLTGDLDLVYKNLMAFQAEGGSDKPESVNQALHEAVMKIDWSKDEQTYKVIFLVGDSPPHLDYSHDVPYPRSCELAARNDIIINTIQCGEFSDTTPVWQEIARLSEGRFVQIEQSGGVVALGTPFDEELARLARELDDTRVFYGDVDVLAEQEERKQNAEEIYNNSSPEAQAQRAFFNANLAGERNLVGDQELVSDVFNNTVCLEELKEEQLPAEMRKMSMMERLNYLHQKAVARETTKKKINELSEQREAYIQDYQAKNRLTSDSSFERILFECLQSQGAKKGINYTREMH